LRPPASPNRWLCPPQRTKVFWFFFSKKNYLLSFLFKWLSYLGSYESSFSEEKEAKRLFLLLRYVRANLRPETNAPKFFAGATNAGDAPHLFP
ncbi:MAG TPA: hypothetical protein VMB71_07195, partial [Acetobacteraceae bacterium]|nr:hypothetical protein [Acetobacteraceae bacterium]